jgi:hypothetical protein
MDRQEAKAMNRILFQMRLLTTWGLHVYYVLYHCRTFTSWAWRHARDTNWCTPTHGDHNQLDRLERPARGSGSAGGPTTGPDYLPLTKSPKNLLNLSPGLDAAAVDVGDETIDAVNADLWLWASKLADAGSDDCVSPGPELITSHSYKPLAAGSSRSRTRRE